MQLPFIVSFQSSSIGTRTKLPIVVCVTKLELCNEVKAKFGLLAKFYRSFYEKSKRIIFGYRHLVRQ